MLECVTLWIGESLGPVERACMRSVLRQGHKLTLYCYREPKGIPSGVRVSPAADVLPEHAIIRHKNGSVALFADWFRYELQRRGAGTWVDTDVYLLAPLDEHRPYLFGEQQPGVVNNAVLRLPAQSPMLPDLLKAFGRETPPWLPLRKYLSSRLRELVFGQADPTRMPWGTTGPAALTAVAKASGVLTEALPPTAFYPAPWDQASWILNPAISLDRWVSDATFAVHLWNERIKHFKNAPPPTGSFLARLHAEGTP